MELKETKINGVTFKENEEIKIEDENFKVNAIHFNEITKITTIHLDKIQLVF